MCVRVCEIAPKAQGSSNRSTSEYKHGGTSTGLRGHCLRTHTHTHTHTHTQSSLYLILTGTSSPFSLSRHSRCQLDLRHPITGTEKGFDCVDGGGGGGDFSHLVVTAAVESLSSVSGNVSGIITSKPAELSCFDHLIFNYSFF